jgi:hypothetical protein
MVANTTVNVAVSFTNTGSLTWSPSGPNPVNLSYHWRRNACPGTSNAVFDGLRTALPEEISTSESVTNLGMAVRAPAGAGTYCLQVDLVREGIAWFSWQGAAMLQRTVTISQPPPIYGVQWTGDTTPATMTTNTTHEVGLSFTNTGSLTWTPSGPNPVNVSYHWRRNACPGTSTAVFDGLRTALPEEIGPGESVAELNASVRTPAGAGTYCLQFDLVREGVTWFSSQGVTMLTRTVNVQSPSLRVTWTADDTPATMSVNATTTVNLSFTNSGTAAWPAGGANPVRVSYHWLNGACPGTSTSVWDGLRTPLPADIATGAGVTALPASVRAPATPGTYCLQFDLVREGVTWFSWTGAQVLNRTVTVN